MHNYILLFITVIRNCAEHTRRPQRSTGSYETQFDVRNIIIHGNNINNSHDDNIMN